MLTLRKNTKQFVNLPSQGELIIATYNFKKVQAVCTDALINRRMIGISGQPGYGKTVALTHFFGSNPNVYLMTVKPSMKAKNFWISLYQSFQYENPELEERHNLHDHRSIYYVLRKACDFLNSKGQCLLIIDEAGKFSPKMLEYLHELRDETKETTGIVLSGPDYFKNNLFKWVQDQKIGMPEVWRRINYWEHLQAPSKNEIKSFLEHYNIVDADFSKRLYVECPDFSSIQNTILAYKHSLAKI